MSGGSISDKIKESSGKDIDRWKEKFHKQVEANNLLSDKLRELRTRASQVVKNLQQAYSDQTTELVKAQVRVAELERRDE